MDVPLKPLPPPRGSPAWIFKEPREFYAQRERQAEREARKALRLAYRGALQEQGYAVGLQRPINPTTIDGDPPARFSPPPLSTVWGPPPYLDVTDKDYQQARSAQKDKSSSSKSLPKARVTSELAVEDNRATICGEKSRLSKEMYGMLKGWSRGAGGNPWTLKQIYAEIEADIAHKKARDTRAKRGHLGAEEVGRGGTAERRPMISFERKYDITFTPGFGDGFTISSSPKSESTMRSCNSLPALTQGAAS